MAKTYLMGVYSDDHDALHATEHIIAEGVKVDDVLSPFPIHGIDDVIGNKESNLHYAGFMFGMTGLLLMISFITWISTVDYPTIYGGKPYFSLPSYVPIVFEFTVLLAAVGMVITFFVRNGLNPFNKNIILDERITDHKFVMLFDITKKSSEEVDNIKALLTKEGAEEINTKTVARPYKR